MNYLPGISRAGSFYIGSRQPAISPSITQPPIRSNDEWGAHSLIGLSNGRYLMLSFGFTARRSGVMKTLNSGFLPIHKTSLTRSHRSGYYQNISLVWLIIVRCVSFLGPSGVRGLKFSSESRTAFEDLGFSWNL